MGLDIKSLIENRVYHFDWVSPTQTVNYICKYSTSKRILLNITSKNFSNINYNFWKDSPIKNIREATQDEIDWLEACERENKFVDKPTKKEFIVGKWYKLNNSWYAKFKEFHNNYFSFTEYINSSGYIKENSSTQAVIPIILLEDLSEIQQYLPDNHVDKIKTIKFKKGEYYYVEDNLNYSWLIKFIECDQNNIIAPSISIITNSFYTRSNWGELSSIKSSRLATSEEKVWLEECIKLNKFIPKDQIKSEYLKVEKLVEGCWYRARYSHNTEILFKVKSLTKVNVEYELLCNITRNYKNDSGFDEKQSLLDIKQASNEEVLKYFPNEKFVMSFEEALVECKRRYPIGTKFHPVNHKYPNGDISETHRIEGNRFIEFKNSVYKSKQAIVENTTSGILWYNGVFAEIIKENKWTPQVGEYVIMEKAGGWSYSPYNNGCLAIITKINDKRDIGVSGKQRFVYGISGNIINSRNKDTSFWEIPIIDREGKIVVRKATDNEIPSTITRVNSQGNIKTKSILEDLDDWEETKIEVKVKTWVIEEPKKTKKTGLQLYEEITPIKVEEVVKLTVKSKINKNK